MVAQIYATSGTSGGGSGASIPDTTPYVGSVTSVPPNAFQTVVSHIAAATFRLYGVIVTGSAEAVWTILDDGVEILRERTSAEERGKDLLHGRANAIAFATGHTITVQVLHTESDTILGSTSRDFWATMLAREA